MSQVRESSPVSNSTNVRLPLAFRLAGGALRLIDAVAPQRAASVAADVFLTPRRAGRPASEERWREAALRERKSVGGHDVALSTWGEGRPILLIHGWEGRGTQLGAFAEPLTRNGFSVVAPDMPAHGSSPGRRTNLLEFAAVTKGLINELNPAAVIAHSFGAAGVTVALRDVAFDGRLVYMAPPEDFGFFTETFGGMLGISSKLAARMQQEVERRFEIDWSVLRGTAIAPAMRAPLLVVHDRDDVDVPHAFGQAIADAWPGARMLTTTGLGHRRILRDASVVTAATRFLCEGSSAQPAWPARGNALAY